MDGYAVNGKRFVPLNQNDDEWDKFFYSTSEKKNFPKENSMLLQ